MLGSTFLDIWRPLLRGTDGATIIYGILSGVNISTGQNTYVNRRVKTLCLISSQWLHALRCTFEFSGCNNSQIEYQVINSGAKQAHQRYNHPMGTHWMISVHQYTSLTTARIHTGPSHRNMISPPGEQLQSNTCRSGWWETLNVKWVTPSSCCCHVIFPFLEHTGATTDDGQDIINVINYVLDVM